MFNSKESDTCTLTCNYQECMICQLIDRRCTYQWSNQIYLPANTPDIPVAIKGVLNLLFTAARNLNNKPSLDMAYITRGRGNMAPSKLKEKYFNFPVTHANKQEYLYLPQGEWMLNWSVYKWTASSEFGTYSLCEQRRFRRACADAQARQNLRCSLI